MLGLGKRKKPTEALIADLEARKAAFTARRPELERARDAALERRREALIDGADAETAAANAAAAHAATDELSALDDAAAEVDRRLAAAVEQRDAEFQKALRDEAASGLEGDAVAIGAALHDLDKAFAMVRKASARCQLALSPRATPVLGERYESPSDIVGRVAAEALKAALPHVDLLVGRDNPGRVNGRTAKLAAEAFDGKLRSIAADVRNQTLTADLPEWRDSGPVLTDLNHEARSLYAWRFFTYVDRDGEKRRCRAGHGVYPAPVVAAAVERKIGDVAESSASLAANEAWDRRWHEGESTDEIMAGPNMSTSRSISALSTPKSTNASERNGRTHRRGDARKLKPSQRNARPTSL